MKNRIPAPTGAAPLVVFALASFALVAFAFVALPQRASASTVATPGDYVIVGHVTWQGRPAAPSELQKLPITVLLKLGEDEVLIARLETDDSGYFKLPVDEIPDGEYSYRVKGPQYLSNSGAVTLKHDPETDVEMGLMRVGDMSDDNLVNVEDFNLLRNAFGSAQGSANYDPRADLSGDAKVDGSDFNLLRLNFGDSGR